MLNIISGLAPLVVAGPSGVASIDLSYQLNSQRSHTVKTTDATESLEIYANIEYGQNYTHEDVRAWLWVELGMADYTYFYIFPNPEVPGELTYDEILDFGRNGKDRYAIPLTVATGGKTGSVGLNIRPPSNIHNTLSLYLECENLPGGVTVGGTTLIFYTKGGQERAVNIQRQPPSKLANAASIGKEGDLWFVY